MPFRESGTQYLLGECSWMSRHAVGLCTFPPYSDSTTCPKGWSRTDQELFPEAMGEDAKARANTASSPKSSPAVPHEKPPTWPGFMPQLPEIRKGEAISPGALLQQLKFAAQSQAHPQLWEPKAGSQWWAHIYTRGPARPLGRGSKEEERGGRGRGEQLCVRSEWVTGPLRPSDGRQQGKCEGREENTKSLLAGAYSSWRQPPRP